MRNWERSEVAGAGKERGSRVGDEGKQKSRQGTAYQSHRP